MTSITGSQNISNCRTLCSELNWQKPSLNLNSNVDQGPYTLISSSSRRQPARRHSCEASAALYDINESCNKQESSAVLRPSAGSRPSSALRSSSPSIWYARRRWVTTEPGAAARCGRAVRQPDRFAVRDTRRVRWQNAGLQLKSCLVVPEPVPRLAKTRPAAAPSLTRRVLGGGRVGALGQHTVDAGVVGGARPGGPHGHLLLDAAAAALRVAVQRVGCAHVRR